MSNFAWTIYFVALGGLLVFMMMRRSGQIPKKAAAEYLRNGAMVIDVRSPAEFAAGHLSQAFNFPVDDVDAVLPSKVKDKNRVILLHCQTGLRSKKAKSKLERIGYKNVFDMGSYERAFKIATGRTM